MNNYSKLIEVDESSRIGNVLHENICSLFLTRLSCELIVNIFEKENFDVGFEVAGTGGNHTQKRGKGKPDLKKVPGPRQSSMSMISKASSSGYHSATRTNITKRSPNKTRKLVRPGSKKTVSSVFYANKVWGSFVGFF